MTITAEQIKFRSGKIGASSMGQAIGRGYGSRTRAELFHQMKGHMPPVVETMAMRVGNYMEDFVLKEYSLLTGRPAEEYPETQVHPDEPRIICHCDGITSDKTRLIEIKNVGHRMMRAWEQGVPEYYWVQGCGQSMLTGIKKVDFAAYFGGNDLKVFEVEYTDEDHAALYDGLKDFLCYMDNDEEPPHVIADLPNLDKYYEVTDEVKSTSSYGPNDPITVIEEIAPVAYRLAKLKAQSKPSQAIKDEMDECEFALKEHMGTAQMLVDGHDGTPLFTWKKGKDKAVVDWESVARAVYDSPITENDIDLFIQANKEEFIVTKTGNRTFLCKIKD